MNANMASKSAENKGKTRYVSLVKLPTHQLKNPERYLVDKVDMREPAWKNKDFGAYDCVFHVTGLAHADYGKVTEEKRALYYRVNTQLTEEAAKKAKAEGVKQFIFMSSANVYGASAPIGNLVEFVRLMLENEEQGTFFPCDKEWYCTSELVKLIAAENGKKIILVPGCAWLLKLLSHFSGQVNKAFGSFAYDPALGEYKQNYRRYALTGGVRLSERRGKGFS